MRTIFCMAILAGLAAAQSASAPSPRPEIQTYTLTLARANQLIPAMEAMTKYVASLPDFQERVAKSMKMSPAERLAQIEKDPKGMAILKQNGLTARDYLIGVPALRMALRIAAGAPSGPTVYASPANIAFAREHLAELKPKMDRADGIAPKK